MPRVGDRTLKGIDLIHFDDDGLIREFEVMIRPLSGLQALGTAMGARLGNQLPAFKQPGSTVAGGSRPGSATDLLRTGRAPARPDEGEA